MPELSAYAWFFVVAVCLVAGTVKGAVGFALPMLMVSGLGSILPAEVAIAGMLTPTLLSNLWQSLRGGLAPLIRAARAHLRFLAIFSVMILATAQLVGFIPGWALFLILGVIFTSYAVTQLLGWALKIHAERRGRAEAVAAVVAGFVGGLSGSWGPPTVAYLTALDTEKREAVRVQGLIYLVGAVLLVLAHLRSGVLGPETRLFSVVLVVPVLAGMAVGMAIQDRLDQRQFKRLTLVVLTLAGLNLVRRGVGF